MYNINLAHRWCKESAAQIASPPKGFDTTVINKSCYNVVLQNSLETENEYSKELQTAFNLPTAPADQ